MGDSQEAVCEDWSRHWPDKHMWSFLLSRLELCVLTTSVGASSWWWIEPNQGLSGLVLGVWISLLASL